MGADGGVFGFGALGEIDRNRRRQFARFPAAIEDATHGIGMRSTVAESIKDRFLQFGRAVMLQELHHGCGERTEIIIACRGADQQVAAGWHGLDEPVRRALPASGALVFSKGLDVCGVLDQGALIVAALVAGDDVLFIGDAQLVKAGEHGERFAHLSVRME